MSGINSKRLILTLIVVAAGLAAAIGLLAHSFSPQKSNSARPKITWSESKIEVLLSPSASASRSLTFTSRLDLADAVLSPTPEIAGFLAIQPSSIANVPANQAQQVTVNFSIPSNAARGTVDGTVHVRTRSQTQPATLKIVTHVAGVGAAIFLPPETGEAGRATLEGIDSDKDSVRDDIQRYIALTYPDSEKTRAALSQGAKAQQQFLLNSQDKAGALAAAITRSRADDCLYSIRPDDARKILSEVRALFLNTRDRSRAYLLGDEKLSGEFYPRTPAQQWKNSCNFDPDSMQN